MSPTMSPKPLEWFFIAPVLNVQLTRATNHELRLGRLTLVTLPRLARCRRRLGLPRPLKDFKELGTFVNFFDARRTYAVARVKGIATEAAKEFDRIAAEELSLLTLSQLGISRRRHSALPMLGTVVRQSRAIAQIQSKGGTAARATWRVIGKQGELLIDELWVSLTKKFFFSRLCEIIYSPRRATSPWRPYMMKAASLIGESIGSSNVAQGFLLNMIAIELLLTSGDDKYSDALPKRVESFLGWATDWRVLNYEERIRECYLKRCDIVHRGRRDHITRDDLYLTDDLLFNILNNILKHPRHFPDKNAVLRFSDKVAAANLLGVKGNARPRTLSFSKPHYVDADYTQAI